jgi:hypothetical protein
VDEKNLSSPIQKETFSKRIKAYKKFMRSLQTLRDSQTKEDSGLRINLIVHLVGN